jgi:hypothetical protein
LEALVDNVSTTVTMRLTILYVFEHYFWGVVDSAVVHSNYLESPSLHSSAVGTLRTIAINGSLLVAAAKRRLGLSRLLSLWRRRPRPLTSSKAN